LFVFILLLLLSSKYDLLAQFSLEIKNSSYYFKTIYILLKTVATAFELVLSELYRIVSNSFLPIQLPHKRCAQLQVRLLGLVVRQEPSLLQPDPEYRIVGG
jgi:hypothetical protein